MLNDLKEKGEVSNDNFSIIIFITDGCAGQYKWGTSLYLLSMLAQRTGTIIYHFVKCAGHGKCRCDAEEHQESSGYTLYESLLTYVAHLDLVGDLLQDFKQSGMCDLLFVYF